FVLFVRGELGGRLFLVLVFFVRGPGGGGRGRLAAEEGLGELAERQLAHGVAPAELVGGVDDIAERRLRVELAGDRLEHGLALLDDEVTTVAIFETDGEVALHGAGSCAWLGAAASTNTRKRRAERRGPRAGWCARTRWVR